MSKGENEDREISSSGDESEEHERNSSHVGSGEKKGKVSEYEKQRVSRIAENKARMEALGLSKMASALMGSSPVRIKRQGKANSGEEDDDYRPSEADDDDEDENDEEDFQGHIHSGYKRRKVKNTCARSKKKLSSKKKLDNSDYLEKGDEDDDLKKAIAISLQDSIKKKGTGKEAGSGKKKKPFVSRFQITEDELIIYFYQFDEEGKGFITVRDVAKMAMAHDFTWTKEELQDMIHCYDNDNGEKLSLDDFRKIITRCRMLKEMDDS